MAFINLLPWREEAEKAKQREYFTLLTIVAVIAFALVFIISQFYQMRIDGQNSR
ncbi:pilus assembly protein PilN, partial [Colwellia sp. BRX8-8]|nr:pilus assembly protein PilN [Colwellia sp. BRX8-8]